MICSFRCGDTNAYSGLTNCDAADEAVQERVECGGNHVKRKKEGKGKEMGRRKARVTEKERNNEKGEKEIEAAD